MTMPPPPPSVTGWTRLEPYSNSETLKGGLRAEVHDPLWLLARQWQFREFEGVDAGSPVHTALRMDCSRLTRYWPGSLPTDQITKGQPIDSTIPLETLIEREPIHVEGTEQLRLAAEAGLHFQRLLGPDPSGTLRAGVLNLFPQGLVNPPATALDPETRRLFQVIAGRTPDGMLLYCVLSPSTLDRLPAAYRDRVVKGVTDWQAWRTTLSAAQLTQVDQAAKTWLEWYRTLFSEPSPAPAENPSWIPERMEYQAAVAALTPNPGEVVLAASEYTDGDLDWFSFNVVEGRSLGALGTDRTVPERASENVQRTAIPVPVSFRGMPGSRFWQFEDARLDFGAMPAGPTDLALLLVIEFALIYANDWFVIPVDVPVGALCQTRSLVVTDTFGERTLIKSARQVDDPGLGPNDLSWDLFGLSTDRPQAGADRSMPDLLFLAPVLGTSLHGAPIEEVLLLRDEMASMAWAVERVIETPSDRPFNRAEAFFRARQQEQTGAAGAGNGVPLKYRLATDVPDYWLPLQPVRPGAGPSIRLERGGDPRGRVLKPNPLLLHDEEVPRSGARVTRAYQYARWTGGQTYVWVGRRKGAGRGEGSSGLRFDVLGDAGSGSTP